MRWCGGTRTKAPSQVLAWSAIALHPQRLELPLLTFRPPYVPPSNRISQIASWKAADRRL
jgi:hypothetical protein